MPTYEYECEKCGHHQDEFLGINEEPEIKCEKCKGPSKRIFVASCNYILRGSGWASKEMRLKRDMLEKNKRMKNVMKEREASGDGVSRVEDLKKQND